MTNELDSVAPRAEHEGGNVVRFEPRLHVSAVLGAGINAGDGTVMLALQGPRNPRIEIVMSGEVAEVVLASLGRALERARQAPPAP